MTDYKCPACGQPWMPEIIPLPRVPPDIRCACCCQDRCPQCDGEDEYCQFCFGSGVVTHWQAKEWHTQNN